LLGLVVSDFIVFFIASLGFVGGGLQFLFSPSTVVVFSTRYFRAVSASSGTLGTGPDKKGRR